IRYSPNSAPSLVKPEGVNFSGRSSLRSPLPAGATVCHSCLAGPFSSKLCTSNRIALPSGEIAVGGADRNEVKSLLAKGRWSAAASGAVVRPKTMRAAAISCAQWLACMCESPPCVKQIISHTGACFGADGGKFGYDLIGCSILSNCKAAKPLADAKKKETTGAPRTQFAYFNRVGCDERAERSSGGRSFNASGAAVAPRRSFSWGPGARSDGNCWG